MTDQDIKNLARECGAQVKLNPLAQEIELVTFTLEELREFIEIICKHPGSPLDPIDTQAGKV